MTFLHAVYALAAVVTSTLLFLIVYVRNQLFSGSFARWSDRIMLVCDTIGLGIFTVVGSYAAVAAGYQDNHFLVVFVGVITGVGTGVTSAAGVTVAVGASVGTMVGAAVSIVPVSG